MGKPCESSRAIGDQILRAIEDQFLVPSGTEIGAFPSNAKRLRAP